MNNQLIEELYKTIEAKDNIINNQALEIARLKEALETKYYCQYANKCNELYDCTREEYNSMAECNMELWLKNDELQQENKQLKEEIKKYINSSDFVYDELYKKREKILEILGDKENE